MSARAWIATLIGVTLLAVIGCQGAGPTTSPHDPSTLALPTAPVALGAAQMGLLGAAKLHVDRVSGTVTLEPMRTAEAIGDTFPLDATAYFTSDPCRDCLKLTSFSLESDNLILEVTARHPFPSVTQRRDLDVFDPRVIVYAPAHQAWGYTEFDSMPPYLRPNLFGGAPIPTVLSGNTQFMPSASGHTTHFDERVDFLYGIAYQGNLNPYINYATELIPNDNSSGDNPERRMSQTRAPETETFKILFPPEIDVFNAIFVFAANYGQSATRATRMTPTYFVPAFNRREAYDVQVTATAPSAGLQYSSSIDLQVAVLDWQQNSPLDLTYPNPSNLAGMPVPSRVQRVEAVLPGWTAPPANSLLNILGTGSPGDPLIYTGSMLRTEVFPPRPDATLPLLIRVVDEQDGNEISNTNPAFDLGHVFDVATYRIVPLRLNVAMSLDTNEPAPGMLQRATGLNIRTAPYANAEEGTSEVEIVYPSHPSTWKTAPARDMRLLTAPLGGNFQTWNPAPSMTPTAGVSYADGEFPIDDYPSSPDAHPNPTATMPVRSLGALPGGQFMASFGDNNFTVNPLRFSTGITDLVANSDIVRSWQNNGQARILGPRLSQGCGSAPGPTFGSRVRGIVAAPNVTIGSSTGFLGYISAGLDSEACGDYARLTYYRAPFSSEADRLLTVNLDTIAVALFGGVPTEPNYRQLARIVPLNFRPGTNSWLHVAFFNQRMIVFNAFGNFDPATRTSNPGVLGTVNLVSDTLIDLCYIPMDPAYPFAIGGVAQTTDWVVALTRGGLGNHRLLAYSATNTPTLQADWASGAPVIWGPAFPLMTEVDFDPVNRIMVLTADSNGVSAGGEIVTSILMTM